MKSQALIEIDKITKVFRSLDGDDVIALEDVSLEIGFVDVVTEQQTSDVVVSCDSDGGLAV